MQAHPETTHGELYQAVEEICAVVLRFDVSKLK